MPQRNPFTVLGLPFDATAEAIKAAWRRLAREHHPDVARSGASGERRANHVMAEINAAYQELRDPVRRRKHREAAAREAQEGRENRSQEAFHATDTRREAYGEPTSWVPRSRPQRPLTGRIDTSAVFHPRNTVLHPLSHSPLPGLPPRPRDAFHREEPRASDPTGPMLRAQGAADDTLPSLAEAMEMRLRFGKFEGRTLREVASLEPSYIGWIVRTIGRDPELLQCARVVERYLERTRAQRRGDFDSPAQTQAQ